MIPAYRSVVPMPLDLGFSNVLHDGFQVMNSDRNMSLFRPVEGNLSQKLPYETSPCVSLARTWSPIHGKANPDNGELDHCDCLPKPDTQPRLPLVLSLHSHLCFTDQILVLLPLSPSVLFHSPKPQLLICICCFWNLCHHYSLFSESSHGEPWTFSWRTMLSLPSGSHKVFLLPAVRCE